METENNFNHKLGARVDQLSLVSELEHIRRHAIRAAIVRSEDEDDMIHYLTIALRARDLRRSYMAKHFNDVKEEDWCLVKAASCLRQLSYEVNNGDDDLAPIDGLVDEILSHALGEDMSGCVVCKEDRPSKDIDIPGAKIVEL